MSDLTSTNPNEPKISYTLNDLEVRSRHSLFHDANIANQIVLNNRLAIFSSYYISYLPLSKYQLASSPDSSLSLPPKKKPIVMPLVINQ